MLVAFGVARVALSSGVRRGQRAVRLEVPAGVVVLDRHPDRRDAVVVGRRAGQVQVQHLQAVWVPVTLSVPSGKASPGTWALIVSEPRWLLDVVSPRSSVAGTENEYVPGVRLNGVVYVQL